MLIVERPRLFPVRGGEQYVTPCSRIEQVLCQAFGIRDSIRPHVAWFSAGKGSTRALRSNIDPLEGNSSDLRRPYLSMAIDCDAQGTQLQSIIISPNFGGFALVELNSVRQGMIPVNLCGSDKSQDRFHLREMMMIISSGASKEPRDGEFSVGQDRETDLSGISYIAYGTYGSINAHNMPDTTPEDFVGNGGVRQRRAYAFAVSDSRRSRRDRKLNTSCSKCDSCKRRKIKCGGERPICTGCLKYREECIYG